MQLIGEIDSCVLISNAAVLMLLHVPKIIQSKQTHLCSSLKMFLINLCLFVPFAWLFQALSQCIWVCSLMPPIGETVASFLHASLPVHVDVKHVVLSQQESVQALCLPALRGGEGTVPLPPALSQHSWLLLLHQRLHHHQYVLHQLHMTYDISSRTHELNIKSKPQSRTQVTEHSSTFFTNRVVLTKYLFWY